MAVFVDSEFFSPREAAPLVVSYDGFSGFVERSRIGLRRHIVRTQTERALSKLSNRLLADIGITRSEITSFAANAANRSG